MKAIVYGAILALLVMVGAARAQDAWVQIEALPTLARAEERARAWGATFPEVNGFRLRSGWYAIVLGPFSAEAAANRLFALQSERLIPGDSYIAESRDFGDRFWPVGTAPVPPAPEDEAPVSEDAPEAEPVSEAIPEPIPEPDETPQQARRSEAELSEEARKELQTALQWFGFYEGSIDGAFGRGTRASMSAWQGTSGFEETGILTARQRERLVTDWREELASLGLGRVVESRAGIEIEMPIRFVEFDGYAPPFVRYREKDGSGIEVLLISQDGTQGTLDGLYDIMQTLEIVPLAGFRERRGTSFVLTGQNETLHSYTWARLEGGMIKGFTLIYPPKDEARMTRVVQIMRESLTSTGPALDPTLGSPEVAEARNLLAGLEIRQAERTRSGVFADAAGTVLTVAEAVDGCARVTLDDTHDAAVVASGDGLALLKPAVPLAPRAVAQFAPADPRIGSRAGVAGFPFGPALPVATVTFGTVEDVAGLGGEASLLRLSVEIEAGDIGGPVYDAAGQVAGVLLPDEGGARQLPPGVHFAVKAGIAAGFLAANGVTVPAAATQGAMAPEDITRAAMDATVLVSCWK